MFKKGNNLLIAASGTGGHIFPALTIAEEIDQKWEITWLGIKNRSEVNLVPKKYKLLTLNFKTPGKKNIFLIMQYIRILFSTFEIMKIINEMSQQLKEEKSKKLFKIKDRRKAIKEAVQLATTNDIVLILGKGHEKYQEIKGEKFPFDDYKVLENVLK